MANSAPAVVTQVTGRAFIRNADGSLTELHVGSHVPPNSEVVTASGGTVALQVDGGMPLVIGENRDVAFNGDVNGAPANPQEAALTAPTGTDSDRLLAALQNGQDPFDNLDPTAALVAGGGDAGGSSFVRLARILETTSPLGLAYPNDGPAAFNNLINSAGVANNNGATNDSPLAGDDANTTTERSVVFGNILTNDTDPNGDALAIVSVGDRPMATGGVSVAGSTGGTFTVFPDGSYVFNPGDGYHNLGAGQSTTSTATYTVTDPSGATSTATITVTVNGVNDAPTSTAIANVTGTDAEKGVNVDVSTHFTDVDNGDKLTFTATGLPPGLVIDPATGKITGTIDHSASQGGDNGHYQVVVTATDASGATSSQTFDWDVTNPGPTATNDAGATNEGATLSVTDPAQGVLANDSDVDGDKLSVTHVVGQPGSEGDAGVAVTGTNGGTFTINADGTYTFTPGETFEKLAEGEKATTSVTYTVSDGEGGTTTATLEVTVTGTNDVPVITPHEPTSPEDPLQGDHGTVVEDTQLSVEGKLDIVDADHDQSFFRTQTNTAGDHGTFSIDATGKWTYNLNNEDANVQHLAVGEHLTETFTVVAADGTTTQVVVTIEGTNDIPAISGEHAGALTEDAATAVSGQLAVSDIDTTDTHTWSVDGSDKGTYGSISVDADGKWTYNVDKEAIQALAKDEHFDETFTIKVDDGHGGTATQVVTISLTGTNDAPIITPHNPVDPQNPLAGDAGTVVEDKTLSVEGKIDITDVDHNEASFQAQTDTTGAHGTFSIDADGKWTYNLDNKSDDVQHLAVGEHLTDTFTVVTADGTQTQVVITIDGTNDIPEISGQATGAIKEDAVPSVSGQLAVSDVDTTDSHTWAVQGNPKGDYGTLTVDADGKWTYTADNRIQALAEGQEKTETFVVQVDDGHGGTALQTVTINVTGTNDTPVVTGDDSGTVKEDSLLQQVTGGNLDIKDADAGQSHFQPETIKTEHGIFSVGPTGLWGFVLNNGNADVQALGAGESLVEKFTVKTTDGTETTVTVTILGTNDFPHISGQNTGSMTEDKATAVSGQLNVSDVDVHDGHSWSVVGDGKSTYGTLTIDQTGQWTFTANDKIQSLREGQTVNQTFVVSVNDGHGGVDIKTVTVTLTGTNDVPVINPHTPDSDKGTVYEDGLATVGGKLDIKDADAGESKFQAQKNTAGDHGTFSIDANGKWTYSLHNSDSAVQALGAGEHLTETFTVKAADGTPTTVTVTIEGANDKPVISGVTTATATEDVEHSVSGQLTVADVDTHDTHTWTVDGEPKGHYGTISVDETGKWTYTIDQEATQALAAGEKADETFTIKVDDGHGGTDLKTVTISITGTNDAPVVTPHEPDADKGTVQEDGTLVASGKLDITDADHDQSLFQAQDKVTTQHGTFSIDADGNWKYTLNNDDAAVQHLAVGEHLTEQVTVLTADGTSTTVTITIDGTNDQPHISGEHDANLKEDASSSVSGQLAVSDIDTTDTHTWSLQGNPKGDYGTLTVDQTGKWTYTADNRIQALAEGQQKTETFVVKVNDGHGGTDLQTITVHLTGTNDAPVVTGDDSGTVKEDSLFQQIAIGDLDIKDADSNQSYFQPATIKNDHGTFSVGPTGVWSYTLNNNNADVQALGAGESLVEKFTVKTADGSETTVTVTILGTNDFPQISGQDTGALTEDKATAVSGQLNVSDVDVHDDHSWSVVGNGKSTYGALTVDQTGKWTFTANDSIQTLREGETVKQTFVVSVNDGHGGIALETVTVTLTGTNDVPVVKPHTPGADTGHVVEDGQLTAKGNLDITDRDDNESSFKSQSNTKTDYGTFTVDSNGNWTYKLDNAKVQSLGADEHLTDKVTVYTADGTATTVTITIDGANDKPAITGIATGSAVEDGSPTVTGQLSVTDVDAHDTHTWTIDGTDKGNYGTLAVDQTGKWTYTVDPAKTQALAQGDKVNETFTVKVDDHHGGTTTQVVTITLTGTNDTPIITPHNPVDPTNPSAGDKGLVVEDDKQSVSGKIDIVDADHDQSSFVAQTGKEGTYGTFKIGTDGTWSYQLHNGDVQFLAAGEHRTETFDIFTADGTKTQVVITIDGTNDQPSITGEHTGALTEDVANTVSGQLGVSDADTSDTHTWTIDGTDQGKYGSLELNQDGKWTYLADPNKIQALAQGEKVDETFTVKVDDHHGGTTTQVVTITLTGTNDTPIIIPHDPVDPSNPLAGDKGTVVEDKTLSVDGKIDIVDADHDQSAFVAQTGKEGTYGTFNIGTDGTWSYQLHNGDVQFLAAGEHRTETFDIFTADGTKTQVVITIDGTNDQPSITGEHTGTLTEDVANTVSGQLGVSDADTSDTHTWTIDGTDQGKYGSLELNQDGKWTYLADPNKIQALAQGEKVDETFTVKVDDHHGGTTTQVVTITLTGTNDTPIITPHDPVDPANPSAGDKGTVVEDKTLSVDGKIDIVDADHDQSAFVAQTGKEGTYGTFNIGTDGTWSYQLHNGDVQFLAAGEHRTETFDIFTADGTKTQVVITIDGTNDQPSITGEHTGTLTEDVANTVSGQLGVSDADTSDTHTWTIDGTDQGKYGSLELNQDGKWTYLADPNKIQALAQGEKVDETFTVKVDDHHGGTTTQVVTITLTGTNDTPIIIPHDPVDPSNPLAGDKGTVVEDDKQSVSGKIDIVDADHDQSAFVAQTGKEGTYGTFNIGTDGTWSYQLHNGDVQFLAAGEHRTETFDIFTADGTKTQVVITIDGTNDQPQISGAHSADVTEGGDTSVSGQLGVSDVDTSDTHTWTIDGANQGKYGSLVLDQNGKWTYNVDQAKIQTLGQGEKAQDTFTVKVDDHHGGTTTQVVTINLTGVEHGAIVTGNGAGTVQEDHTTTATGKLDVTDQDPGQAVFQAQTDAQGQYGKFSIDADGNWTYNLTNSNSHVQELGANEHLTEQFTVTTADGTTSTVTITINGDNDIPTISGPATGNVQEDGTKTAGGQLTVGDVDIHDGHTWSINGSATGNYGSLTLSADGKWTYTLDNAKAQALTNADTKTETFTVKVDDGHGGTATQEIKVIVQGKDDGAVIQPHNPGDGAGTVQEDHQLSATGKLDVTDPDANQAVFQAQTNTAGQYGKFSIDANGTWTYNLTNSNSHVQELGANEHLTEQFTVTTADGTTSTVTITINGDNDIPTISGPATGNVQEDGTKTAGGQLTVGDVDIHDGHTWSINGSATGSYGSLTLSADGKWTYTLDNAKAQALTNADTKTETFTVKVDDGHGGTATQEIKVIVQGKDDGAIISGNGTGSVTEDAATNVTSGKLTITDPDAGQAAFIADSNHAGQYGTFSIDAGGNWTYTLNNNAANVQALSGNDHPTETFTVTSVDGTTSTVVVTVNGTNDAPTATDNATTVNVGQTHMFTTAEFNFADSQGEHNTLQSVIITHLPDNGTLTFNGQPVTANQVISQADIAAGKLVFTPASTGAHDTDFGFKVVDNGGTDHGGQNTSTDHTFSINTGNITTGTNDGTPINGGHGDDVLVGDQGGVKTTTTPGQNYNIALIVDHSGSMSAKIDGTTRMQLVKDALTQFVKQLAGHDGIVNVTLIGFGDNGDTPVTIQNLNLSDVDQATDTLMKAITALKADGATNYEDAFNDAKSWFDSQASAHKGTGDGYQNLSFFMTDGDPTVYGTKGQSGQGDSTDQDTLQHSVDAFSGLSNVSTVYGIGIGDGVNTNLLQFFDNTNVTGQQTVVFSTKDTNLSTSSSYDFDNDSSWNRVTGGGASAGGITENSGTSLTITDTYGATGNNTKATIVDSDAITVATGSTAHFTFDLATANIQTGDVFSWALQQLVNGIWTNVQSGTSTGQDIATQEVNAGQYRFEFQLQDNTSNKAASLTIDDFHMITTNGVTANAGQVDIVHQASDLNAALNGGSTHTDPAPVGNDTINGGDGNDIIFGDTINTDALAWTGHAAGSHNGAGMQGLVDYLTATNGHAPTSTDLYSYISQHSDQFNVAGDTRGGNDVIHGGAGNDIIYGQGGSDTIVGGQGNDTLYGGEGSDTFKWELNDQGTVGHAAVDTIKDFNSALPASGGDVLNLNELLHNPADASLSQYLHFSKVGNNTEIQVSTTGNVSASNFDQKIVLENVDLVTGHANDQAIIQDLINKGKLQGHHN